MKKLTTITIGILLLLTMNLSFGDISQDKQVQQFINTMVKKPWP